MSRASLFLPCLLAGATLLPAQAAAPAQHPIEGDTLRLNQIQVIGTHNSYHAGLAPSAMALLRQKNPRAADSLDYSHPALATQLDGGVRQLELDVFYDPQGGRYAHPAFDRAVAAAGLPADPPYDPTGEMNKPGFKVMHVQGLDQRSNCALFTTCLRQIRTWSEAHPGHVPIFILVETKQGKVREMPEVPGALPFTPAVFSALEAEVLSVFKRGDLITPDQVRGNHATLPEAIAHGGWPALETARGKIVFLLDQRPNEPVYTEGHPALAGRLFFTNATPGAPDAAFTEANDFPAAQIDALAKQGYLIRTRTDEDTRQARTGDTTRRDEVMRSGAQILSTDYPTAEPARWSGYHVAFPGGAAVRCDPVTAPTPCPNIAP